MYYSNTENNFETPLLQQFKFYTIGNLGQSRPYCGHTKIQLADMLKADDFVGDDSQYVN